MAWYEKNPGGEAKASFNFERTTFNKNCNVSLYVWE